MRPVYFAHGYRKREAPFASHFGRLLSNVDFLPSLDPPSKDVNSAKLERHLKHTDALVAILSAREEGPSLHILYEISMALRTRKPCLVFVEDTLPDSIVPKNVLKCRFSSRSYFREAREHIHAVKMLKTFCGEQYVPKYDFNYKQRSCIMTGFTSISEELKMLLKKYLKSKGYNIYRIPKASNHIPFKGSVHFDISSADLAICIMSSKSVSSSYIYGIVESTLVPTIQLAINNYPLVDDIPADYQRRIITNHDYEKDMKLIADQIELYEEDFVEIDSEGKVERYAKQLADSSLDPGQYSRNNRINIINEIVYGDRFDKISKSNIFNRSILSDDNKKGRNKGVRNQYM